MLVHCNSAVYVKGLLAGGASDGGQNIPTVQGLLESLEISQYRDTFLEEGYSLLEDLEELSLEELMDELGMKKPHAKRILTHFAK